jgi:predicted choloylglycine hydrolase
MIRSLVATALCVTLTIPALGPAHAASPFRYPEGRCGDAWLKYVNGVPVLAVAGTPEEIGKATGALALQPGRRMAGYPDDLLCEFHLQALREPLLLAGRYMLSRLPADYRSELEAMYSTAGVNRDLAVLNNTFYDLKKTVLCSALLVGTPRSKTGGPLLGRNLEYPPLGYAQDYSLVTVYRPRGARHAFASIGFPGMVGCLSGMNDAGLTVAVLEVYQVKLGHTGFNLLGMPFALCFRRLLEECSTIEEALSLLKTMKRTGLNNLVVADREGVAVFEITPDRVVVRQPQNDTCVCTNHFCTPELRPLLRLNLFESDEHFDALEKVASRRAKLGLSDLQQGLHTVCDPEMTMQTMVFEPRKLRLHLAIGDIPSSAGVMHVLDLGVLFQKP